MKTLVLLQYDRNISTFGAQIMPRRSSARLEQVCELI